MVTDTNEVLYSQNRQFNRFQPRKSKFQPRPYYRQEESGSKQRHGQKINPIGFNGKPNKCKICESILHYAKDCPHKRPSEENITLFIDPREEEMCLFTSEARNSAVLDSGCTSTVAGQSWINCYLQTRH